MQDYIEQFTNAGKNSYNVMQEFGVINSKAMQKLTDLQFEIASNSIESGLEQFKNLGVTTSYKDFLAKVSDYFSENSSKAIDYSKKTAAVLAESRDEVVELLEKGFDQPVVKKTGKTPAKRTAK